MVREKRDTHGGMSVVVCIFLLVVVSLLLVWLFVCGIVCGTEDILLGGFEIGCNGNKLVGWLAGGLYIAFSTWSRACAGEWLYQS